MHLGGVHEIQVDVRILAATNVDLRQAVREGKFREDLFYRLNVITIDLPPLRTRREDIPLLAASFLKRYAEENDLAPRTLAPEAMRVLMDYDWPGNVRELENVIEQREEWFSPPLRPLGSNSSPGSPHRPQLPTSLLEHNPNASLFDILEDIERRIIIDKAGTLQVEPDGRGRAIPHSALHAEPEDQAPLHRDQKTHERLTAAGRYPRLAMPNDQTGSIDTRIKRFAKRIVLSVQNYANLTGRAIRNIFQRPQYIADLITQSDIIGFGSLPIVLLSGFFTGGVLALQSAATLSEFGATAVTGRFVRSP